MKNRRRIGSQLALTLATAILIAVPAHSQSTLYGGMNQSKGYVVGAALSDAGLTRYDGDSTWTHVGPKNPRVSGISFHPDNPDVIFLAAGNGVLRSVDAGNWWRIVTDWHVTETQDIEIDPNATNKVYVATAYGVWRSENGGDTWTESNDGISIKYTQAVEIDRTKADRLFAGTSSGLYLSETGAKSWVRVSPKDTEIHDVEQARSNSQVWIAGGEKEGILRSTDGGKTWRNVGGLPQGKSIYSVTIHPTDANRMAAVGWEVGVLFSDNGGDSWRQIGDGVPVPNNYEVIFDLNNPDRLIVATVEEGLFYTDNAGASWNFMGGYGTLVFDLTFQEPVTK